MDTLLEGIFKEIITNSFFTEQEVKGMDTGGNLYHSRFQSPASLAVTNLVDRQGFYEGVKDALIERLSEVIKSGKVDALIAEGITKYIITNMTGWNQPSTVLTLFSKLPEAIASKIIEKPDVISKINIDSIVEKVNQGEISVSVTLKK